MKRESSKTNPVPSTKSSEVKSKGEAKALEKSVNKEVRLSLEGGGKDARQKCKNLIF